MIRSETVTLVLVNLAGIMERADESLLPGVYREVGAALHADPTRLGSLTLFRSIVQSSCYPLAAYLAVRHNRTHVIAWGAFLWAAATFLVAMSSTFVEALIFDSIPFPEFELVSFGIRASILLNFSEMAEGICDVELCKEMEMLLDEVKKNNASINDQLADLRRTITAMASRSNVENQIGVKGGGGKGCDVHSKSVYQLMNLRQSNSVKEYLGRFEELKNPVELSEQDKVSYFLGGLRPEIAVAVRMFRPGSLSMAASLAKLQEQALALRKAATCGVSDESEFIDDEFMVKSDLVVDENTFELGSVLVENSSVLTDDSSSVLVGGERSDIEAVVTVDKSLLVDEIPAVLVVKGLLTDQQTYVVGMKLPSDVSVIELPDGFGDLKRVYLDQNMLFDRGKRCIEQLSVGEYYGFPFDRGRRGVVKRMNVCYDGFPFDRGRQGVVNRMNMCLPFDRRLEGTYRTFDRGRRLDEQLRGRRVPNPPCGRGRCGVVESLLQDTALALKYMPFDRGRWIELQSGKDLSHCNSVRTSIRNVEVTFLLQK